VNFPRIVGVSVRALPEAHVYGATVEDSGDEVLAGIVQAVARGRVHIRTMTFAPLAVYELSVVVLFFKFFVTISLQARERMRARGFRYPEDATTWHGVVGPDTDLCQRADRLLRNDAESQPFYLVSGAILVALAPSSRVAPFYFVSYVLCRCAHAYWLLSPRQPHRNRAFALGLLVVFVMIGHASWAALALRRPTM
jgi:MAPEG family